MQYSERESVSKIAQAEELLQKINREYGADSVFTSSFGAEDMIIMHLIARLGLDIMIATIDTGRLHQETYDLMDRAAQAYGISIRTYFPDGAEVEDMVSRDGQNLFYLSHENRELCCTIRKVKPLDRILKGKKAWITGIRADQNKFRTAMGMVEEDSSRGILKVNPLIHWSSSEVWDFIRSNRIPYNSLHNKGYPSIGCEPCTRAVLPGEDERAGRWWWDSELKECGLHLSEKKNHFTMIEKEREGGE